MTGLPLPDVGDRASVQHQFSRDDIAAYAQLSGDNNPIHLDEAAARHAGFDGVVAHGMLVAGLISRILGTQLPGPGTIYLGQELRFLKPIYPDRLLTVEVAVTARREDKPILTLSTEVRTQDDLAIQGTATVLVRR
jgi:acyl dehydratase